MKAVIYKQYGGPDVLQIADVPKPILKSHQILVKVRACTVNRTDTAYRSAQYFITRFFTGLLKPKKIIVGTEFAGDVVEVGQSVSRFEVGDRVFGYNEKTFGACAEFVAIDAQSMVTTIPENFSYQQACCCTEGFHYALNFIKAANIRAGNHVLVYGATGAIGSAAVQILAAMGVHVNAVCGEANMDLVSELGAQHVMNYEDEHWFDTLVEDQKKYDVVLDCVGKLTFGFCKSVLSPKGIYISSELGPKLQNPLLAVWTHFFSSQKVLFPIPSERVEDINYAKALIEKGQYRAVIDRVYSIDDIVEASRYVETGQKIGSVVIVVT